MWYNTSSVNRLLSDLNAIRAKLNIIKTYRDALSQRLKEIESVLELNDGRYSAYPNDKYMGFNTNLTVPTHDVLDNTECGALDISVKDYCTKTPLVGDLRYWLGESDPWT